MGRPFSKRAHPQNFGRSVRKCPVGYTYALVVPYYLSSLLLSSGLQPAAYRVARLRYAYAYDDLSLVEE